MTVSVMGMYNYDNSLFDNLTLPEQFTEQDRSDLIDKILSECAELEVVYPDFTILRHMIGVWSRTRLYNWSKLYDTMYFDYNPIYNTDRHMSWGEKRTTTVNETESNNVKENGTSESNDSYTNNGSDTTEREVTGFNTETYVDSGKDTTTLGSGRTGTADVTAETERDESRDRNMTDNRNSEHFEESYGNIGVTTTQEMIEAERKVVMFNLFDVITEQFKQKFCVMVW